MYDRYNESVKEPKGFCGAQCGSPPYVLLSEALEKESLQPQVSDFLAILFCGKEGRKRGDNYIRYFNLGR